MTDVRDAKLNELTPDAHNANKGTERGRYMLDHSLRQYGAGRSILVDKHGRVIAGNKTLEAAADIGLEDVVIVRTVGDKLVVVQRDDLDLDDGDDKARLMAYADNRAGQIGLEWDADALKLDLDAGLDLGDMWAPVELAVWTGEEVDPTSLWQGMPEFEQEDLTAFQTIKVHFATEEDRSIFAQLVEQVITDKTRSIWYPKAEVRTFMDKRYIEQS